jgi:pimeloyl-ACP methyl ester carboxylesterase
LVSIGPFVTIWRRSNRKLLFILTTLITALVLPGESRAAQRVTLRTDDGVILTATWYEPPARGPAVILVHMLHRSRRDFDALASRLASEGIGALALDLRGHGDSQGSIGTDFAPMVADVKAARRFLIGRSDVSGKIGLFGASLGANPVALAAADDPGVASLARCPRRSTIAVSGSRRRCGSAPAPCSWCERRRSVRLPFGARRKGTRGREILSLTGAGHGSTMLERESSLMARWWTGFAGRAMILG